MTSPQMARRPNIGGRRTWPRWCLAALAAGALAMAGAEVAARYAGFGDPPVVRLDESIEYYLAPGRSYTRFGQSVRVNRYGMRSDDADLAAVDRRLTFSVFGDSVVYGHMLDQADTLPARLQALLRRDGENQGLLVNSVAASSWGPENLIAFYRRFGPFPGKTAWIVQSTHDMVDVIDHTSVPYSTMTPYGALHDVAMSAWRRLRGRLPATEADYGATSEQRRRADVALHALIEALKDDYERVVLVFHATRSEAISGGAVGLGHFEAIARAHGVGFISTMDLYARAYAAGTPPHSDEIHLSRAGAEMLAERLAADIAPPNASH